MRTVCGSVFETDGAENTALPLAIHFLSKLNLRRLEGPHMHGSCFILPHRHWLRLLAFNVRRA